MIYRREYNHRYDKKTRKCKICGMRPELATSVTCQKAIMIARSEQIKKREKLKA